MKLLVFLITIILGANVAKAQNSWINYKIDDKLSVKLPGQPTPIKESSVYVRDKDTTVYIISKFDVGLDSAQLVLLAPTTEFANGFKKGMLTKMPGSVFGDVHIKKWNGYNSYNVDGENATKKLKIYTFMVIIGTNSYNLMVISHENYNTVIKDSFFASLMLN